MEEVKTGSISKLDWAKTQVSQMPNMTPEERDAAIGKIVVPFFKQGKEYFMMYCHELKDYTIFKLDRRGYRMAAEEFKECFRNRGHLISIELTDNKDAVEIWDREDGKVYCYYLFKYDDAVIECYGGGVA